MEKNRIALPPLLETFVDGKAKWKGFDNVDFERIGLFLTCHLVVEHYLDEFLKAYSPVPFSWKAAKLTFGQKVALISGIKQFPDPYNIPPVLKHFNGLRNKISHDVRFNLSIDVLLPEVQFLERVLKSGAALRVETVQAVLERFTSIVCVYFASAITHCAEQRHNGLNGVWKM